MPILNQYTAKIVIYYLNNLNGFRWKLLFYIEFFKKIEKSNEIAL